jgi:predicted GIY-YIG superfamily endonuclease
MSKSMLREYRYYVYIMQSSSRRALYIGMTNNLRRRVFEHKMHLHEVLPINTTRFVSCIGSAMTTSTKRSRVKSN